MDLTLHFSDDTALKVIGYGLVLLAIALRKRK